MKERQNPRFPDVECFSNLPNHCLQADFLAHVQQLLLGLLVQRTGRYVCGYYAA